MYLAHLYHFFLLSHHVTEEFGRDLEHVEVLQKKFDEFQKDMANNEDRVAEVNQTADTLIMEQHPDGDAIQKKREVRSLF